ncbi:MAG TPA: GvpL/GvpF family gas vesicle protein [Terriglobales bacterium]|nr:GvpL/GvpF family gas vesicle protein [Terriglobales bacterium]
MPLLAYCVMEASAAIEMPSAAIAGARVEELQGFGLRCCFSRFETREHLSRVPAVESAYGFHQVLQALFRQVAIIPFRFPSLLENVDELRQHLREHAPQYIEALSRLRDMVQLEIHIGTTQAREGGSQAASGREYLQQRQARAAELKATAESFNQATRSWVVEWRERPTDGGIRCYALLRRDSVTSFQRAAQALSDTLPGARLSGPWPPAEFLELKDL